MSRHRSELILGGARSGKSRHALARAGEARGPVVFVATAQPFDGRMRARIALHRRSRPSSWTTIEEPLDIVAACRRAHDRHRLAVIDCLTLWASNRLLRGDADEAILAGADELAKLMTERLISMIVVSNEVGAGVHPPTEVGLRFQDLLGAINQRVAAAADRVTLMVAGIALTIKDMPNPATSDVRPPEAL